MPLYEGVKADPSSAAASRAFACAGAFSHSRSAFCDGIQSIDVMNTRPHGVTFQ
jgi:hypothetical protein